MELLNLKQICGWHLFQHRTCSTEDRDRQETLLLAQSPNYPGAIAWAWIDRTR